MLSEREIEKIAGLARIKLTKSENKLFQKELSGILDFFKQLEEVDTKGVEPFYQITGLANSYREDKHGGDFEMNEDLNKKLIEQAPHKQNRFIKVKSVLSRDQ